MDTNLFAKPLLATEHSEYDVGAERIGFALAKLSASPLPVVLPMLGNAEFDAVAPEWAERADAAAAAKLGALRESAAAQGVQLAIQVRRGPELYAEIVDEARARRAGLIVIRRRGKSGLLANLLVGDMVGKVVAHAPCNVLVNGRDVQMWTRRVLAALDPEAPDMGVLVQAARAAVEFELPLTLVSVAASDRGEMRKQAGDALDAGAAQARALGARAEVQVLTGKAHEQIVGAVQRLGADLVVLGRRSSTHLSRAFIGGVAQKVVGLVECPVLVCVSTN